MAVKVSPPGQDRKLREYYIRFEGSMYGVLHVDNEAHTVGLIPLKEIDNIPVFGFPHGGVFLRSVLCDGRR